MRSRKLILLSIVALGLASSPAFAQKRVGISIGTGVSVGARFGLSSVHVDFRNSHRHGYVSSRRPRPSIWTPGHYETVYERAWIPASKQRIWIEPVYATRYDSCGRSYRVIVESGCWRWVETPGHYESRPVNRWVAGCYD